MKIQTKQGELIEIFADKNKVLDIGDGEYCTYVCVPTSFDTSTIKEIPIEDVDENNIIYQAKQKKIEQINMYDISTNVNGFYVNGNHLWIPRETRVSLQNSTEILMKNDIKNVTLWEGTMKFVLPCDLLLHMLDELEIYALQCFNVTAEHKANIMEMTDISEIENYDYTIGYPEKLTFNVD